MTKISVIIPVHNSEKTLKKCLDSVLLQKFKDIEVICVDDGSNDNSLKILEQYKLKYNIIIQKNQKQGAGSSRNIGLDCANGEYLYFLDSDDCLEENSLNDMYKTIKENNANILIFNYTEHNVSNNNYKLVYFDIPQNIKGKIFCANDFNQNIFCNFDVFVWNKLFKSDFIKKNNIRFQEIQRTNDVFFVCTALVLAEKIFYFNKSLIFYSVGQTTNMQNNNYKCPTEFTKASLALLEFLRNHDIYEKYEKAFKQFTINEIDHALRSLKSHPTQYYELAKYLDKEILKQLDIKKSDTQMWSYIKILLVWIFSIRSYRGTGYKILNIFGHQIWIKCRGKKNICK